MISCVQDDDVMDKTMKSMDWEAFRFIDIPRPYADRPEPILRAIVPFPISSVKQG